MGLRQLLNLVRPFRSDLVHTNPSGGGQYVGHDTVTQRLLQIVGPFDFHLVQIVRGYVPEIAPNPNGSSRRAKEGRPALNDAVVGVVMALTVTIDGATVTVHEAGDCEDPHNWPHDGARMKDAFSDAIKRCAMRIGCGLHLWAQQDFYLHEALTRAESETGTPPAPGTDAPAVGAGEGTASVPPAPLSPKEKLEERARKLAAS